MNRTDEWAAVETEIRETCAILREHEAALIRRDNLLRKGRALGMNQPYLQKLTRADPDDPDSGLSGQRVHQIAPAGRS